MQHSNKLRGYGESFVVASLQVKELQLSLYEFSVSVLGVLDYGVSEFLHVITWHYQGLL